MTSAIAVLLCTTVLAVALAAAAVVTVRGAVEVTRLRHDKETNGG